MKSEHRGWRTLALAGALAAAAAFGCGGGGGGGSHSGTGTINGNLTKASSIQTASLSLRQRLMVAAGRWLGAAAAIAQSATTTCGNPEEAAAGVTVNLLLPDGTFVQSTTTDSDGHFTFTGVAPGNYVIQVTLASGTISAPAIVQPDQTTNLSGELDVDCEDIDADHDVAETAIHVEQETEDGSHLEADETEDGGEFHGDVKTQDGGTVHQSGTSGDRNDEVDTEDSGSSGSSSSSGSGSSGSGEGSSGSGSGDSGSDDRGGS